ncbi:C4-dicarboxylate ABC transporter permease [Pseudooceanicola lipolyticus]|uniref:TRAP transporter large permease protein n=1 Tax=Pseudooceanicola lipolyticus TaxID=2029104 RepID=A0A2M8J2H3_9RHOB|nr:TRAP transporter large permease subunit [Pseudooceanicola lipolyticus]PJE36963.1 C4-dicarboxylate ABC transporter permease [Pseudooceanicola lipolyticus]
MDAFVYASALLGLIIAFLISGVWIFIALIAASVAMLYFALGMDPNRIGTIAYSIMYRAANSWELSAIPLFIWMGEIIFRSDISERIFRGLAPLVSRVPGRLLHSNVLGCTLFAAVSGSTAATTATVGKITTTKLREAGYNEALSLGSLAGAGSFGLLIPPSIVMIVYGIMAEVSISRLFAAGVIPGLMLSAIFSGFIIAYALLKPSVVPQGAPRLTWRDIVRGLKDLLPITTLMIVVLGSIYTGIATPSEAAAIGVLAALIIVGVTGQLSVKLLSDSLKGALTTSAMICSLLVAAAFLSTTMGYLHIPGDVARVIQGLELSPAMLILILTVFYIYLGLFLDGVSIIVTSLPIALPLAISAGFDPVWFGIFLILTVEMGQITPPVGFNLFVIQSLTGRSIGRVALYAAPFFLLMLVAIVLLTAFPEIALWLPGVLYD